jgi:hypothetical protein
MINLTLRNNILCFNDCSFKSCLVLLAFAPIVKIRSILLKLSFHQMPEVLDGIEIWRKRRLRKQWYTLRFEEFPDDSGCMNWCIILHKDLLWLPAWWDRFFEDIEIWEAWISLLRRSFISNHYNYIKTISNLDCTLYYNTYILALFIRFNYFFILFLCRYPEISSSLSFGISF